MIRNKANVLKIPKYWLKPMSLKRSENSFEIQDPSLINLISKIAIYAFNRLFLLPLFTLFNFIAIEVYLT